MTKRSDHIKLFKTLMWLPPAKDGGGEEESAASKRGSQSRSDVSLPKAGRKKKIFDIFLLNEICRRRFSPDLAKKGDTIFQLVARHPSFKVLESKARKIAMTYTVGASIALACKEALPYWLLEYVGPNHPGPMAFRKGTLLSWKRPMRTLRRLAREADELCCRVQRIEGSLVSRHETPEFMINRAVYNLYRALEWMEAFPSVQALKIGFRDFRRPDPEGDSCKVLAYSLDTFFRKHSHSRLKVTDIECHIAAIENEFLKQNVSYHRGFGCEAVRQQITRLKKSPYREVIDRRIREDLASNLYDSEASREKEAHQRSEQVAMVLQWCESAERHITSARERLKKDLMVDQMEADLASRLLERLEYLLAESDKQAGQLSLQSLANEIAERRTGRLKKRADLTNCISRLCTSAESQLAKIRQNPFLAANADEVEEDAVSILSASVIELRELESQLLDAEAELVQMDSDQLEKNSQLLDMLKSIQPPTDPDLSHDQ